MTKISSTMTQALMEAYGRTTKAVQGRVPTLKALESRGLAEYRVLTTYTNGNPSGSGYALTEAGVIAARMLVDNASGVDREERVGELLGDAEAFEMRVGVLREDAAVVGWLPPANVRAAILNGEAEGQPVERLEGGALRVGYSWFMPVSREAAKRNGAHVEALRMDAARTASMEGVGRGVVEVSREPQHEGFETLGEGDQWGEEFYLLVNGWRVGGSYFCSADYIQDGERWASWGPAGLSMGHPSREAAEGVQVAAWVVYAAEQTARRVALEVFGAPELAEAIRDETLAHVPAAPVEEWREAGGLLVVGAHRLSGTGEVSGAARVFECSQCGVRASWAVFESDGAQCLPMAAPVAAPEGVQARPVAPAAPVVAPEVRSCRSEDGITEGLVDAIIAIHRILARRDLGSPAVQGALSDMFVDPDFAAIEGAWLGEGVDWGQEGAEGAQERPAALDAGEESQGGAGGAVGRSWVVVAELGEVLGVEARMAVARLVVDATAVQYLLGEGVREVEDALSLVAGLVGGASGWRVEHDGEGVVRLTGRRGTSWVLRPVHEGV